MIARTLSRIGIEVAVVTTDDDGPRGRLSVPLGEKVKREGFAAIYFKKQTEFYKVSLPLARWLKEHICEYDVAHIHALFSFTSNCAAWNARRAGVPYIIRPLGVLNDWGVQSRRPWLKKLSLLYVDAPVLRHAAAMHYTSEQERIEAERNGATAPAAIIPLPIDVAQFDHLPLPEQFFKKYPAALGKKILLFLSRLDPKKGLEILLPAYAEARKQFPETILVIAGSGGAEYEVSLKTLASKYAIEKHVLWPGFLTGEDKLAAFSAADVFVMPSKSENFGIALVEALACGKPCVVTPEVGISSLIKERDAGLIVSQSANDISGGICRLLENEPLRNRLGRNARELVLKEFSGEVVGQKLAALYHNLAVNKNGRNVTYA